MTFARVPHSNRTSAQRRAEILASPGFGRYFTDHMVTIRWSAERGWHDAEVGPYRPLTVDPGSAALQYGQAIFEGMKVYRQPDGSVATFRPEANAARFRASAARLAMPELPDELFLTAVRELVTVDEAWVPAAGGEDSLYLRPFLIGVSSGLLVGAATDYVFCLIATPAGPYFSGGPTPIRAWLSTDYVRAVPGGTGAAKCGANYAASLAAQAVAVQQGCDQVVWLDAVERRWVEEMGVMNLFFVFGSGADLEVVTPELDGSLLPGVTRDSLLTLAADLGAQVRERPVSIEEWRTRAADGSLTEVFASGTAAVVTPVGSVKHHDGAFTIADGQPGVLTRTLRERLGALQRGEADDPHGWMHPLTVE